jgi:cyanate lyase
MESSKPRLPCRRLPMAHKFTMYLPEDEAQLMQSEAEKLGISLQQYLRIFALQATRASAKPAIGNQEDLTQILEMIMLRTQGLANLIQTMAGDTALSAVGIQRLLNTEYPGKLQPLKRKAIQKKKRIALHWRRVMELTK